ncbi:hypothetical protein VTH82DRAFT_1492 [Thermothelomyces myriococcoides]
MSAGPYLGAGMATPEAVDERELRRLESEVFDTAKYVGVGDEARYLTVLTWSEDSDFGTITLLEVDLEQPPPPPSLETPRSPCRRRRVTRVKPVAAMEDVPRQVLKAQPMAEEFTND